MNKEQLAACLDGRQYGQEITYDECRIATESGLVVIYGQSDDLIEFDGVYSDEIGAYHGETFCLMLNNAKTQCFAAMSEDGDLLMTGQNEIEAVWNPNDPQCSWMIKTRIPHAPFKIYEGDDLYCVGIVIDIRDLEC